MPETNDSPKSSKDLFLQREVKGVRIALWTRIIFICLFTIITQGVAQNQFEKSIVFLENPNSISWFSGCWVFCPPVPATSIDT